MQDWSCLINLPKKGFSAASSSESRRTCLLPVKNAKVGAHACYRLRTRKSRTSLLSTQMPSRTSSLSTCVQFRVRFSPTSLKLLDRHFTAYFRTIDWIQPGNQNDSLNRYILVDTTHQTLWIKTRTKPRESYESESQELPKLAYAFVTRFSLVDQKPSLWRNRSDRTKFC